MGKIILITGGARSGKSDYALQKAETYVQNRCFIATCPVIDSEMDDRIKRHKAQRSDRNWQTIEEEIELEKIIFSNSQYRVFLVDCLTLWINNLLYRKKQQGHTLSEETMAILCTSLIKTIKQQSADVIFVTNEVGMGIVPNNPMARLYRDLIGRCNRLIATAADEVFLLSCGIPLCLKT